MTANISASAARNSAQAGVSLSHARAYASFSGSSINATGSSRTSTTPDRIRDASARWSSPMPTASRRVCRASNTQIRCVHITSSRLAKPYAQERSGGIQPLSPVVM